MNDDKEEFLELDLLKNEGRIEAVKKMDNCRFWVVFKFNKMPEKEAEENENN